MAPKQKPHRSKQDYATPPDFLAAVKIRLGIDAFTFDFAADSTNHVARAWWSEKQDALSKTSKQWAERCQTGWGWLNPPFATIRPWAEQCCLASEHGANIALLVPAAVGSNWFRDYVDGQAYVLALNGRLAFMPDKPTWLYPKDCLLALYSPKEWAGFEVWDWRATLAQREAA